MAIRKLKARGIGRFELLSWLNEFLETDYTKIEHLADGIAYCQIFDVLYPGKVPLHHVNFHAQYAPEFERNLRILKRVFDACQVRKEIPIKKLVQGVFHEHFDFLHWVHDYVHRTCPGAARGYHAYARREEILSQQPKAAEVNVNLVPRFSMRNGLFQSSGIPVLLEQQNSTTSKDEPLAAADTSEPPTSVAQQSCADILSAFAAKHGQDREGILSSKQKETVSLSKQLRRLNSALELDLHGRIQALDKHQHDIATLLAERKQYLDCLKDVEVSSQTFFMPDLNETGQFISKR
ncbi:microtubule-associated protein, RP/EB family [Achlya hypogyna]|uniref:Microtubule-associated protein, RP/EB family n=1 Tax=Achlya hypogyna TaxID=1202772 RepID=A0A1V9YI50_ACHHY|nr:microtubule-associated protein, RP/EB family [Achlya hypogyna]